MNNKKDQYQIYIDENKTVYYYKNKELHRENGPAIVKVNERRLDKVEDDNGLYSITFNPVSTKKHLVNNSDVIQLPIADTKVKNLLKVLRENKSPLITFSNADEIFADSPYFLDGLNYSKAEFDSITTKDQAHNSSRKAKM